MKIPSKKNQVIKIIFYSLFIFLLLYLLFYIINKGKLRSGMEKINKIPFHDISKNKITKFIISNKKNKVILEKKGDNFIVVPGEKPADKGLIRGIIKIVSEAEILGIASINKSNQKKFGLYTDNSVNLSIFLKNSGKLEIIIGNFAPDMLSCYFSIPGDNKTYLTLCSLKYAASVDINHWYAKK